MSGTPKERPKVGMGIYIRKDGRVLMGKRRGTNGPGFWCPPGGHLEMFEEWEECAKRETMEEAGVTFKNFKFISATNDFHRSDGKHYITLHCVADWAAGEPSDVEPDKIGDWGWYAWEDLPQPLFLPSRNFIKTGYNPLDI